MWPDKPLRQTKRLVLLTVIFVLAGCASAPMTPCPDPDPNPISPCATSHSQTHGN